MGQHYTDTMSMDRNKYRYITGQIQVGTCPDMTIDAARNRQTSMECSTTISMFSDYRAFIHSFILILIHRINIDYHM